MGGSSASSSTAALTWSLVVRWARVVGLWGLPRHQLRGGSSLSCANHADATVGRDTRHEPDAQRRPYLPTLRSEDHAGVSKEEGGHEDTAMWLWRKGSPIVAMCEGVHAGRLMIDQDADLVMRDSEPSLARIGGASSTPPSSVHRHHQRPPVCLVATRSISSFPSFSPIMGVLVSSHFSITHLPLLA